MLSVRSFLAACCGLLLGGCQYFAVLEPAPPIPEGGQAPVEEPGPLRDPPPERPVAVCASPSVVGLGERVAFDGRDSYHPRGSTRLAFHWQLTRTTGAMELSRPDARMPMLVQRGTGDEGVRQAGVYEASLVVTDPAGTESSPCTQTITVEASGELEIELEWVPLADLDLHLLAPGGVYRDVEGGTDCHYANCTASHPALDWGVVGEPSDDPILVNDERDGPGPERLVVPSPYFGRYTVVVNDHGSRPEHAAEGTVTITLFDEVTTFDVSLEGEDAVRYVAEIDVDAARVVPCDGVDGC